MTVITDRALNVISAHNTQNRKTRRPKLTNLNQKNKPITKPRLETSEEVLEAFKKKLIYRYKNSEQRKVSQAKSMVNEKEYLPIPPLEKNKNADVVLAYSASLWKILRRTLNSLDLPRKSARFKESLIDQGMKNSEVAGLTEKASPLVITKHAAQRIEDHSLSREFISNAIASGKKARSIEYKPGTSYVISNGIKHIDANVTVVTNRSSKTVITAYPTHKLAKKNTKVVNESDFITDEGLVNEVIQHPTYLRKKLIDQGFRGKDIVKQLRKISSKKAFKVRMNQRDKKY